MTDQELKERPYKGTWGPNGYCNSTACDTTPASYYHNGRYEDEGNNRWYCAECASRINQRFGSDICRTRQGEIPPSTTPTGTDDQEGMRC